MAKFLTVKEAAERATVSPSTIYSLLRQRKIPAARIGCRGRGGWRIEAAALDAYLESCKVAPLAEGPLRHLR